MPTRAKSSTGSGGQKGNEEAVREFMATKLRTPPRPPVVGPWADLRCRPGPMPMRARSGLRVNAMCAAPVCRSRPSLALGLFAVGLVEVLGAKLSRGRRPGPHRPQPRRGGARRRCRSPSGARPRSPSRVTIFGAIAVRALVADPLEIYPPQIAALIAIYTVGAYAHAARRARGGRRPCARAGDRSRPRYGRRRRRPQLLPAYILAGGVLAAALSRRPAPPRRRRGPRRGAARSPRSAPGLPASCTTPSRTASRRSSCRRAGRRTSLRRDPDRAPRSRSRRSSARPATGLSEMRRLLGLIGDGSALAARAAADARPPRPSWSRDARDAGLDVDAVVEGAETPLPAAVDLSAYRIVQEALTNTMKHAGPLPGDGAPSATAPTPSSSRSRDDGARAPAPSRGARPRAYRHARARRRPRRHVRRRTARRTGAASASVARLPLEDVA